MLLYPAERLAHDGYIPSGSRLAAAVLVGQPGRNDCPRVFALAHGKPIALD